MPKRITYLNSSKISIEHQRKGCSYFPATIHKIILKNRLIEYLSCSLNIKQDALVENLLKHRDIY
ncbi:MAG: hypothetical protein WBJ81_05360 [Rickettsiales bacterium]